jgi:hypothetical protein
VPAQRAHDSAQFSPRPPQPRHVRCTGTSSGTVAPATASSGDSSIHAASGVGRSSATNALLITTTTKSREWVCPECDYFEEAEDGGS